MKRILYTEEEGGDFHHIAGIDDADTERMFDEAVSNKRLIYSIGERVINIRPAYIELTETDREYDFVLGSSRKDYGKKEKDAK